MSTTSLRQQSSRANSKAFKLIRFSSYTFHQTRSSKQNKVKNNSSTASFDTTEKPSYIPEQLQDVIESPEQRVSTQLKLWFDPLVFFTLFIVGLPIYYIPGSTPRSLPLFLSTLALAWIFSRRVVPATWQKIFHPLLVTSLITLISIWGLGAIKGSTLKQSKFSFSFNIVDFCLIEKFFFFWKKM